MPSLRKHRSAPGHLTSFVESRQQLESNAMVNARTIIHRGFNEGTNMFDLSSLNLVRLPEDIADIQYLTFASNKASGPFSSNNIQLYLANNSLTRLPPCIYNLVNVTVLSLRGNNLKELPSSIANLVNLTELSVSSNQLRMLPAELLKLPKLENLGASPNPFVEESVVQVDRRLHNSNTTLREISLRKLVKLAPRHITTANQDITLQLSAMRACSVCNEKYFEHEIQIVLKETMSTRLVPFLYRICSLSCVQVLLEDKNNANTSPGA